MLRRRRESFAGLFCQVLSTNVMFVDHQQGCRRTGKGVKVMAQRHCVAFRAHQSMPADRTGGADAEPQGGLAARRTLRNRRQNARSKVQGQELDHRSWPPRLAPRVITIRVRKEAYFDSICSNFALSAVAPNRMEGSLLGRRPFRLSAGFST